MLDKFLLLLEAKNKYNSNKIPREDINLTNKEIEDINEHFYLNFNIQDNFIIIEEPNNGTTV